MRWTRALSAAALAILAAAALCATPARAQVVRGTVVHQEDGTPVAFATVLLAHARRGTMVRTVTDSAGRFSLRAHPRGSWELSIGRVEGWYNVGPELSLMREDTFSVVVEIPREVLRLPALNVVAHTRSRRLEAVGYYRRSMAGMGSYIGPARIAARNWGLTSRLLAHASTRILVAEREPFQTLAYEAFSMFRPDGAFGELYGRGCRPTLFIDGMRYGPAYAETVDMVVPEEIEGIEIYPNSWAAPPEYTALSAGCGAILVWTRT